MRRPRAVVVVVAVLVAVTGTAVALSGSASASNSDSASGASSTSADTSTEPGQSLDVVTATATRQDLIRTETLTGTLSYGEARSVSAHADGVVTSVAEEGTQIAVGTTAYAIDTQPTILLSGSIPAYRELSQDSSDGGDVTQLEQALVDLGFGSDVTVDGNFDAATADAVEAWEDSLGRADPDGTTALGDVLFATGAVQVAQVVAPVGAQVRSGDAILEATSTVQQIDVDVAVDRADDIVVGTPVTLDLPDGSTATGTVSDVGTTPEPDPNDPTAAETVPIVVLADSADATACCTSGSVDVAIERSRDEGVVAVPVASLLALAEGGYAVEVIDARAPGGTRLVAVEPGGFADDLVAVTGIDEGADVVVAQ